MSRFVRRLAKAIAALVLLLVLVLCATAVWVSRLGARARADYPPAGRFVDVGGVPVHYIEAGQSAVGAPVVVLIHGNPGSTRDFELVVPALAATHRVIAVD